MNDKDRVYLVHIVECIARITSYVGHDKEAFANDAMRQDATVRNLQVLAESSKRVSQEMKSEHPDIEWDAIAGFRNVLVHDYLDLDVDEVWRVVTANLPDLDRAVRGILRTRGWEEDLPTDS